MRKFKLILSIFITVGIAACGSGGEGEAGTETTAADSTAIETTQEEPAGSEANSKYIGDVVYEKGGIKLRELNLSPDFITAKLESNAPTGKQQPGNVGFSYTVTNYELGRQTLEDIPMANSGKGQHIHLILNNDPYSAHYEPAFQKEMEPGHYVALSFLSRSYHESVKTKDAYTLTQFTVGASDKKNIDVAKPLMFYSRPKGTYTGADTKYVLLDFYLINIDLSEYGYKVRATINGTDFLLDNWEPYVMEGLPMGENTVKLELLDKDGNLVDAPFNPVERTVTLSESAAS